MWHRQWGMGRNLSEDGFWIHPRKHRDLCRPRRQSISKMTFRTALPLYGRSSKWKHLPQPWLPWLWEGTVHCANSFQKASSWKADSGAWGRSGLIFLSWFFSSRVRTHYGCQCVPLCAHALSPELFWGLPVEHGIKHFLEQQTETFIFSPVVNARRFHRVPS